MFFKYKLFSIILYSSILLEFLFSYPLFTGRHTYLLLLVSFSLGYPTLHYHQQQEGTPYYPPSSSSYVCSTKTHLNFNAFITFSLLTLFPVHLNISCSHATRRTERCSVGPFLLLFVVFSCSHATEFKDSNIGSLRNIIKMTICKMQI